MILNLLIIAFLCVFVVDYSGFIDGLEKILTKAFKSKFTLHIPKPFSCSLCMTWWTGLIYLFCTSFTLTNIFLLGIVCTLTPEILSIIYFFKDLINKIFITLEEFLKIY